MVNANRLRADRWRRERTVGRPGARAWLHACGVLLLTLFLTVGMAPQGVAGGKASPKATATAKKPATKKPRSPSAEGTDLSKTSTNPLLSPALLPVENLRMALYENLTDDRESAFNHARNGAVVFLNPLLLTPGQRDKLNSYVPNYGHTAAWAVSVALLDPLKEYLSPDVVDQLEKAGYPHLYTLSALNTPTKSKGEDAAKGVHSEPTLQGLLDELDIPWQAIALAGSERQQCGQCAPLYHPETPLVFGRAYGLSAADIAQEKQLIAVARQQAAAKGASEKVAQERVEKVFDQKRDTRNGKALEKLSTDVSEARKKLESQPGKVKRLFATPSQSPCQKAGALPQSGGGGGGGSPDLVLAAATIRAAGPCDGEDDESAGAANSTGLGPALTQQDLANGGIDFSTLELRYLADPGDGSGLQYSFSAGLDPMHGDNRRTTGASAASLSSDAFFTWLELNPSAFWVNLNPTEPDRIVDSKLGRTDAGRIMLQADLGMKKSIGKLIHPDSALGRQFWGRMAGTCMSYRTWIVPEPAKVHQDGDKLYILDAPLNVEMETQYLKVKGTAAAASCPKQDKATETHNEQLFRSLVLPELKNEINTAPEYADLRRVYLARVAAEWYRDLSASKHTAYGDLVDKGDIDDWTTATSWKPTDTFHAYVDSYTKGEFNVTRKTTEGDTVSTRTYVYGGVDLTKVPFQKVSDSSFKKQYAHLPKSVGQSLDQPATDTASSTVWLGAPTPKQVAAATAHHGISARSFVPVIRLLPELALLVLVVVFWRRRRLAAAGPSGRGGRFRRAGRTSHRPRDRTRTRPWARPREKARSSGPGPAPGRGAEPSRVVSRPVSAVHAARPDGAVKVPPGTAKPAAPGPEPLPAAGHFTLDHLARVVRHLARPELDRFGPNDAMVTGIRQALTAGRPLGEGEVNFLRHQLTESALMDGGASAEDAYEAALRSHPAARNYSPEVIDRFPELFNNAWRRAWGMDPR
ncbi:hypothetical protein [Actinacidiphila yanglinensis]|uniref:hypothetical protein n=1 Tax=Actinacidiphila yanglinensis TaxID=310779 RepID=UPI0011B0CF63|nr:hypothetical protein [Actinacidiphila yanglinensis]